MKKLENRKYQERTLAEVSRIWNEGTTAVLVVSPPGSGKTEMGMMAIGGRKTLWVVHTRELAIQALRRLREQFGGDNVSAIMGGYLENPDARIQVATVQSLLLRGIRLDFDLVVLDEAHHYVAPEWNAVLQLLTRRPLVLGLTATPERADGQPLGDVFEELVVAAQYSELRDEGYIVPCRVVSPIRDLGADYAQHPVDAYAQWSGGGVAFAFFPLIRSAQLYADEWIMRGVDARCVHSEVGKADRAETFAAFERGECRVLSTVAAIIEGVNVPNASAAILGRSFEFVGGYLQATGRVLRSHPDKTYATVIDLTGATVRHGPPDADRTYSLEGKGITSGGNPPPSGGGKVGEPEVFDVRMEVTQNVGATIAPMSLDSRDPGRLAQWRRNRMKARGIRTKHGAKMAQETEAYFKNLEA